MLASPDPPALTSFQAWTFPPSTLTVVSFWLVAFDLLTLHIFLDVSPLHPDGGFLLAGSVWSADAPYLSGDRTRLLWNTAQSLSRPQPIRCL